MCDCRQLQVEWVVIIVTEQWADPEFKSLLLNSGLVLNCDHLDQQLTSYVCIALPHPTPASFWNLFTLTNTLLILKPRLVLVKDNFHCPRYPHNCPNFLFSSHRVNLSTVQEEPILCIWESHMILIFFCAVGFLVLELGLGCGLLIRVSWKSALTWADLVKFTICIFYQITLYFDHHLLSTHPALWSPSTNNTSPCTVITIHTQHSPSTEITLTNTTLCTTIIINCTMITIILHSLQK